MTTDIQLKVLTSVVEMLEEQHEERGWDNSPTTLYRVCSLSDTDPDVLEHLPEDLPEDATVGGFDVQSSQLGVFTDLHPRQELAMLAATLDDPDTLTRESFQRLLLATYPSPVITHILISEMWMNVITAENKAEFEKQRAGRMLADIPGTVEGRFAMAILADHMILLRRIRGKDPEVQTIPRNGPSTATLMGGMAESMCKFHDRVVVLLTERAG
jgi:hypothetical protein